MENNVHHIIPYKVYVRILIALVILTGISVAVTQIELGVLTVTIALMIASVKSSLVLIYFMHLKFDNRLLTILLLGVIFLMAAVILVTFLDYLYR